MSSQTAAAAQASTLFKTYLRRMKSSAAFGGTPEICAIALVYPHASIFVHQHADQIRSRASSDLQHAYAMRMCVRQVCPLPNGATAATGWRGSIAS